MRKSNLLITFTFILISASFANEVDTKDLVKKIKNINSMTANFEQKLVDGQDEVINSKGQVSIKKPYFLKWITTSPNKQEIYCNGYKIWIYDADLDQLIIKKASNNIAQLPYLILLSKDTDNINKLFSVNKQDNSYILKPKDEQMIDSITIKFTKDGKLEYLEISTSLNQFTQIRFTNVRNNIKINNSSFEFKIPSNVDVIDQTKGL